MLSDATLDLLKFTSFPKLAEAVKAVIEPALDRWQAVVVTKLPLADELTRDQLRDELPLMLGELSHTLASSDGSHFAIMGELSEGHGRLRFHQSFNINELLIEYGLLRPILLDEIATYLNRELTHEETAALNMGLDTSVRKSVNQFTLNQQKQLTTVAEAQSKYLSFLSHDLRGGLNGVLLMIEVLKRELDGEKRFKDSLEDLDSMRRSILDTVGTMDRFLHAERFRQGKVQPRNSTVDFRNVISELQTQFSHQARAKGIEFATSTAPGNTLFTDRDLLLLILQNLISNAIKYTSKGRVSVFAERKNDGTERIMVGDTGAGIAPQRMATLFEPFTRGETHGQDGVGLGLSIARQAADLIGAKLSVESTVGVGSTFILELRPAAANG